jgi:hypothetical protein
MILAGFHPLSAHVIIVNSILWVDILVSQGPATWKSENKTQYDAMAWFQRDAVRDLIEDCANQCVNLAGFLAFGEAAKASILEWARERFAKRGIFMQPKEVLLEHPENISGRRVNPENAIVMVKTLISMLSTVGVEVPTSTTDEVLYHIVPTKSTEIVVNNVMDVQASESIIEKRNEIEKTYITEIKEKFVAKNENKRKAKNNDDIEIEILLSVNLPITLSVPVNLSIAGLKKLIDEEVNTSWDDFALFFGKEKLVDENKTIADYEIDEGSMLRVELNI